MQVGFSEYLESRAYNRKLFNRVRDAIAALDFDATANITMSAKTQHPMVIVHGRQNGEAADAIHDILDEYFWTGDPDFVDMDRTDIVFRDQY